MEEIFRNSKVKCPRCKSEKETQFRYFNNKGRSKRLQPRYVCKQCHKYFTLGGKLYNICSSFSSSVCSPNNIQYNTNSADLGLQSCLSISTCSTLNAAGKQHWCSTCSDADPQNYFYTDPPLRNDTLDFEVPSVDTARIEPLETLLESLEPLEGSVAEGCRDFGNGDYMFSEEISSTFDQEDFKLEALQQSTPNIAFAGAESEISELRDSGLDFFDVLKFEEITQEDQLPWPENILEEIEVPNGGKQASVGNMYNDSGLLELGLELRPDDLDSTKREDAAFNFVGDFEQYADDNFMNLWSFS